MTPSKKLNEFLYANNRAAKRADDDVAAEREIQPDRDLSPETKSLLAEVKAKLKAANTSSAA